MAQPIDTIDNFPVGGEELAIGGGLTVIPTWSPSDLNLELWYDCSDTSTITESAGKVSQIDDKSGAGLHLLQATEALQPTTGTRTQNERNVVDFVSGQYMQRAFGFGLLQPSTVFLAIKKDVISGFYYDGTNTANRNILLHDTGSGFTAMFANSFLSGAVTTTFFTIFTLVFNTTASTLRKDGAVITTGNVGTQPCGGITMFSRFDGTGSGDGVLGEMFIVNEVASDDDISSAEEYLANKWGVSI